MEYTTENQGGVCNITMRGTFSFNDNGTFQSLIKLIEKSSPTSVVMDLSQVEFVDSAALGMLLLLRGEVHETLQITLRGAHGQVRKMFELGKFGDLFVLEM